MTALTVGEVEGNLTELIRDELVDSVIEFEINGVVYHRHVDSDDEEYNWGDWQDEEPVTWMCYDERWAISAVPCLIQSRARQPSWTLHSRLPR